MLVYTRHLFPFLRKSGKNTFSGRANVGTSSRAPWSADVDTAAYQGPSDAEQKVHAVRACLPSSIWEDWVAARPMALRGGSLDGTMVGQPDQQWLVEGMVVEGPASLVEALGAAPLPSDHKVLRERGAAADVLLAVAVQGVPTVLAYLQAPATAADLARRIRSWRKDAVADDGRVQIRAVRTSKKVEVTIDAPANVSVGDLERLIRRVVEG